MPAALPLVLAGKKYNWYYKTTPQKHLNNRVLYCTRGRVLVGSSSINGNHAQSDKEIDEFLRQALETDYHPTSTCKMGDSSDKMYVVDNKARVFGVEGLRVVDASIMPSLVSGNTNAPTMMIAQKAADHVLGNELLPRLNVPVFRTPEKGQR